MIELREVQCLLALSEQLHFGRAARELQVSQSRVSQTVRKVEQRIGGRLFERTSREVRLTTLGAHFIDQLQPLYKQLVTVYDQAVSDARGLAGATRLGFTGAAGGRYVADLIRALRTDAPEWEIVLREVACGDLLGPLRRGEVDVLAAALPVDEPDLTVGPVIAHEPRMLATALDHPAAQRGSISIEEIADDTVFELANTAPDYWRAFHLPTVTPAGRVLRRGQTVTTCQEILTLAAAGQGVAPMLESVASHYARPDVAFVRIHDLPVAPIALIWRTAEENTRIRALAESAARMARRSDDRGRPTAVGPV
ncbi:LysR family transcriptional regulator [Streptomyces netropsis]|uniref:LysR family transcriptional regulator n=1 Tax=Streptomyces netropsis TaxID=55404 RepID=UPI0037B6C255